MRSCSWLPLRIVFFCSASQVGCDRVCMDLIGLIRPPAPGFFFVNGCFSGTTPSCILWGGVCNTPRFPSKARLFSSSRDHPQLTTPNNSSSTTVQAAKSRRYLNILSMIATTTSIIRTLIIRCGITIPSTMIGLDS